MAQRRIQNIVTTNYNKPDILTSSVYIVVALSVCRIEVEYKNKEARRDEFFNDNNDGGDRAGFYDHQSKNKRMFA